MYYVFFKIKKYRTSRICLGFDDQKLIFTVEKNSKFPLFSVVNKVKTVVIEKSLEETFIIGGKNNLQRQTSDIGIKSDLKVTCLAL